MALPTLVCLQFGDSRRANGEVDAGIRSLQCSWYVSPKYVFQNWPMCQLLAVEILPTADSEVLLARDVFDSGLSD